MAITVASGRTPASRSVSRQVRCRVSMDSVTAFAPATVSNVACGFDVLGFALTAPGDEVTASFSGNDGGVRIAQITGDDNRLPRDAAKNTAGVAARALLTRLGERRGVA